MNPLPGRAGDPRQILWLRDESDGSNAPGILAAVGTLTGLSTLVLWLRCYVRGYLLQRFNAEEYIITVAWLCAVGVLVCFVLEAQHGVGRFSKDITDEDEQVLSKLVYYHSIIVMVGLSLVKISLAVFLRRFSSTLLSKALVGSIIFLVAFTIACGLTLILQCIPVAAAWDTSLQPHARCFDSDTYTAIGLWNSITNLVTDVIFATLPIPLFIGIQVNWRTKFSLIGVLSLGYLACVAGIVKIISQVNVLKEQNMYRHDTFMIWNCAELNVAILAACLPSLKPLLKPVLDGTRSLTTGRRNTSAYRYDTQGYYVQRSTDIAMKSMPRVPPTVYDITAAGSSDGESGNWRESDEQRLHRTETGIMKTTEVVIQTHGD
ncbi:oxidoreductase [Aspergillus eucalypticola CBS 122712]|uniref:Oxidoreductase n=1 Tax=Aspergillus eucalypticola (strain CBS 122712 / IBT 29274) TaxID=1448314 RepID=A0A317WDH9_ASPEC|nr:oxidoreductase [Aspergillus eucalypticola CBS 122712]PWY84443.1 oxidoreductase [Aspergillus eucalypticola CBS 122712]